MGNILRSSDKIHPYETEPNENVQDTKTYLQPIHRKPTDVCSMTIFAIFLVLLCCMIGYCVHYGQIDRVLYGYDNCGTICKANKNLQEKNCVPIGNFGGYSLVLPHKNNPRLFDRICTNNCSNYRGYELFLNRCIQRHKTELLNKVMGGVHLEDFFVEVSEDFNSYWKLLIFMCLLSLGISLSFLILFPFLSGAIVWVVLVGTVAVSVTTTTQLWKFWSGLKKDQLIEPEIRKRDIDTYLVLAIISTITTIVIIVVIFVMLKRIKLVIQLFREAGRALSAMPALLLEPILTFLSIIFTICTFLYFFLWINSSGHLTKKRENVFYYKKDPVMNVAEVMNIFGLFWMIQFVTGCQHMVIAGAVSKWYFSRQKSKLTTPITESFYNLTRFHLGTVALGSLVLAIVQILRKIAQLHMKLMDKYRTNSCVVFMSGCLNCCLWLLEKVLNVLTRNAYIVSAMSGYSLFKSGKEAFNHLASNPLRVATINSLGDFVLFLSKVLVVVCNIGVATFFLKSKEEIHHPWVPILLVGVFSYFISHCFMTVYEMTIDTIFICFCEDCKTNDGGIKPYFMSRGLMEFVENSKTALKIQDKKDGSNKEINYVDKE